MTATASTLPASTTYAEILAGFAAGVAEGSIAIPPETAASAAERLLDNIGCMLVGVTIPPAKVISRLATVSGRGPCRVMGETATTSATGAALANGTLAQAFEMNDLGVYVHPGACVIPAALAAMDQRGTPVSGAALLAAIIAGYEITVRVSECVGPAAELDVGWHTPPFHGAIGAAVAASMILGSNAATIAQAIAIAADIAGGGLMLARLGTDVKRLHCGRGAEAGVLSALLAREGLVARLDVLENADWGYCRTMTASLDKFDLSVIDRDLGKNFIAFPRTAIKYYPVGAEVLGVIDNVNRLKREHGLVADAIADVLVGTPRFFLRAEAHEVPTHISQIHFNVEYGAAMALLHDIRPVHEMPEVIDLWKTGYKDPRVVALARRVRHVVDEALERMNPYAVDSRVEIRLKNGTSLVSETAYVRKAASAGTMQFAPMARESIVAKFRALSRDHLSAEAQQAVVAAVLGLATLADARRLWPLVGAGPEA